MITRNPTSNQHGYIQADLAYEFRKKLPKGKVIIKCSIKTQDGVKVADVAWASDEFITQYGFDTPYLTAPEICVEVIRASNSKKELSEKMRLYFNQGAKEVWLCDQKGQISYFTSKGKIDESVELNVQLNSRISSQPNSSSLNVKTS